MKNTNIFLISCQVVPNLALKPGFHMSGKSQTIRDFTSCGPSQILPIYRIFARGLSEIFLIICDRGTGVEQFRGLVTNEIHR